MTHGGLGRFLRGMAANAALFDVTRAIAYAGTYPRLAAALALRDGERLLDLGCGTGVAARLRRGSYVGVDPTWGGLTVAQRRVPGGSFAAMSAGALGFRRDAFDKAVCVNVVHHLDAALLDAALLELRRVVRGRVVVLDVAPELANPLERFFIRHDRGEHVRSRDGLRALLARRYTIEREEVFHNTFRTVPQALFVLIPEPLPAA